MSVTIGEDGCPAFTCTINFDQDQLGYTFKWAVIVNTLEREDQWAITTEVNNADSADLVRSFVLSNLTLNTQHEIYYLNESRHFGAQKYYSSAQAEPSIRFCVWAPNAQAVEVVMSYVWDEINGQNLAIPGNVNSIYRDRICGGYISDGGAGIHPHWGPFKMMRQDGGIWITDVSEAELADFKRFDHALYMFRVTRDNGDIKYRSDIFSRCQIGFGSEKPTGPYKGNIGYLNGVVSCSVVVDPDMVTEEFKEPVWPEKKWLTLKKFWEEEKTFQPRPVNIKDMIIYELHVGALGFGKSLSEPGTLKDAINLLDYLVELGVNTIELLPLAQFGTVGGWGYSTSHYMAIEYSGGGRDQYKHFIKECHRRGIAVILDVVFNHYAHEAERAEAMFDTNWHDKNCYYWYEGKPWEYPTFNSGVVEARKGTGGYLDNVSTGWAPRYHEEYIRKMFISSAVALVTEFHIDGFRIDQTTSIYSYNVLVANGQPAKTANQYGKKLLRELNRTLKLISPKTVIIAEDHSNNDEITRPLSDGGMGFDAAWYADFYHHLIGDTDKGTDYAKILKTAGLGDNRALALDYFSGALNCSGNKKVIYNESHDEAGNGNLTDRNICVAVNGAYLTGVTRQYAEARSRVIAGITILSAGTPMFLFGEEVGAQKKFLYANVLANREDLFELKQTTGKLLFKFYNFIISFRKETAAIKSDNIQILEVNNVARVLLFKRWLDNEEYLVAVSFNDIPFINSGYTFKSSTIPAALWTEVLNSDLSEFGGSNLQNLKNILSTSGNLSMQLPANSIIVLHRHRAN